VVLKNGKDDFIKKEVTANVIDSEEITFLCEEKTLCEWKVILDFEDQKLGLKEKDDTVFSVFEGGNFIDLIASKGGHMLAKLEMVGIENNGEASSGTEVNLKVSSGTESSFPEEEKINKKETEKIGRRRM